MQRTDSIRLAQCDTRHRGLAELLDKLFSESLSGPLREGALVIEIEQPGVVSGMEIGAPAQHETGELEELSVSFGRKEGKRKNSLCVGEVKQS